MEFKQGGDPYEKLKVGQHKPKPPVTVAELYRYLQDQWEDDEKIEFSFPIKTESK